MVTDFIDNPIGTLGNAAESQTLYVATRKIVGYTLLDGPGANDNRGFDIDLANYATVTKAMKKCKKLLPVIMINYHSLKTGKATGFLSLLEFYSRMFCHNETALAKVSVIFNHVPDDVTNDEIEDLLNTFYKSKAIGNTAEVKQFLGIIMDNLSTQSIFRPLESKSSSFLRKFKRAKPISNASTICQLSLPATVLSQLEIQLKTIQLNITEALASKEYETIQSTITLLVQL